MRRCWLSMVLVGCLLLPAGGGCAPAGREPVMALEPRHELAPREAEAKAEAVRRDPRAYLRLVAQRCRKLEQYTLRFTRYERRGLLGRLYGPEHIQCWFRREPFSIRMKWLNPDLKYDESVYVADRHGNKVRFVTRWWNPPLLPPPKINAVDLRTPVFWGESQRPLTDFGLERLLEQTVESLEAADGRVTVTYLGFAPGTTTHHLRLVYEEGVQKVPIQELYIDAATDLPVATTLRHASGKVDATYIYEDLNTNVRLTDDDFLLTVERPAPPPVPTARQP